MNASDFDTWLICQLARFQNNPEYPMEPPASLDMVRNAERLLGRALPTEYRHMVMLHGAGPMIFSTIASLDPASPHYLFDPQFMNVAGTNGDPLLQVMPDGCGGFYGFPLEDDVYQSRIVYVYEAERTYEEMSPSLFEHLVASLIPEHLR